MTTPRAWEERLLAVPERCAFCHKVVRERPPKCSSNDGYDHKDRPDWPAMAALVEEAVKLAGLAEPSNSVPQPAGGGGTDG